MVEHRLRKLLLSVIISGLLLPSSAFAAWAGIVNLGYSSDSFTLTSASTQGFMHYGVALVLELDRKGQYLLGYAYGSNAITENDGTTTTTFNTTDLGPYFAYYVNRTKTFGLHLGYNLQSTAKYNDGTTPQEWQGGSYSAGFSLENEVSEGFWFGFKLTLYSMTYSRDITLGATATSVSYSRSWITPLLTMSFR